MASVSLPCIHKSACSAAALSDLSSARTCRVSTPSLAFPLVSTPSLAFPRVSTPSLAFPLVSTPSLAFPLVARSRKGISRSSSSAAVGVRAAMSAAEIAQALSDKRVQPRGERLLVKLDEPEQKSAGGVLLPTQAVKYERYLTGQVVSAGEEVKKASVGQKIMFPDMNAYEVAIGDGADRFCFVREGDIMAVLVTDGFDAFSSVSGLATRSRQPGHHQSRTGDGRNRNTLLNLFRCITAASNIQQASQALLAPRNAISAALPSAPRVPSASASFRPPPSLPSTLDSPALAARIAMARGVALWLLLLAMTAARAAPTAVRFQVEQHAKCVGHDLRRDTLVAASYAAVRATHASPFSLDVSVTSPAGVHVYMKEGVGEGQVGFTAEESGEYHLCFWLHGHHVGRHDDARHQVEVTWREGQAASHMQQAATKERVESFEWEVKRLEGLVEAASNEMIFFHESTGISRPSLNGPRFSDA
ncbi:unnamed protein product [Closterium sp. Yama58-4]|nr:unnamed protein product [Closterium sp. Yama58-4]